ncbi:tRNA dihydrouridine synthase [Grosmannia clavigera kw1407]|uniref:tRNA-dihydrouridine(47) synthase [NAD(P)(+)] n=1 Tax=Grosmannia clavigera (strain kw1407 / UAMH 11150) TaxID=655863 RepID=F0XAK8_GROCL|nr:tRNA dihydrouridine synthase [Grosmannia clavigera kw1407]EFX05871.1 tRNA dihydrouridine synthase [Grosmannia clavigera kw1407]
MSTLGDSVGQGPDLTAAATEPALVPATVAATTRAHPEDDEEHRSKRTKTEGITDVVSGEKKPRVTGIAPIKEEYLIDGGGSDDRRGGDVFDDDEAEGRGSNEAAPVSAGGRKGKRGKNKGQNKERDFGWSRDAVRLCTSVANSPEFSPKPCRSGERCRCLHSVREYLSTGRRGDVDTFDGRCPVFELYGRCPSGWRCRFVSSHMEEVEHPDGRKELVLVEKETAAGRLAGSEDDDARPGVVNVVAAEEKHNLMRKRTTLDKSEAFIQWLDRETSIIKKIFKDPTGRSIEGEQSLLKPPGPRVDDAAEDGAKDEPTIDDYRAQFVDPPFLPSEKRRLYFGPETPTLAPLTTQGNLPFRRLCVELGCEATYSEMALGLDLLTGKPSEWALLKAHATEAVPPRVDSVRSAQTAGYDNGRDLRFGAQIAANQPWMAIKATEALSRLVPHLRLVDMNCGCPIEMLFKTGGGSGLLEAHNKLERMIRGMNAVSGEVPITAKLRVGVRDGSPTAHKVIERLAFGGVETRGRLGAPGCAAITLHGRTRNQRYKKPADWRYIAECAALVRSYNESRDKITDTVREPDDRTLPPGGRIFFLGNGDCFSHEQYRAQIDQADVDTVMIGRGALVKPWIFEEIAAGQYLDKSASERLAYIERFARYGMEAWGTDEQGLGTTRRFLLEHLSFTSRYVPVGLLEHLPPSLSDRPPAYRSRNELEGLLASRNYKDWIKISEMFLGPAHPDFRFVPKHKSNSYEGEAEG